MLTYCKRVYGVCTNAKGYNVIMTEKMSTNPGVMVILHVCFLQETKIEEQKKDAQHYL